MGVLLLVLLGQKLRGPWTIRVYIKLSLSVIYSQNTPIQNSLFAHITLKLKMACRLLNSNVFGLSLEVLADQDM